MVRYIEGFVTLKFVTSKFNCMSKNFIFLRYTLRNITNFFFVRCPRRLANTTKKHVFQYRTPLTLIVQAGQSVWKAQFSIKQVNNVTRSSGKPNVKVTHSDLQITIINSHRSHRQSASTETHWPHITKATSPWGPTNIYCAGNTHPIVHSALINNRLTISLCTSMAIRG